MSQLLRQSGTILLALALSSFFFMVALADREEKPERRENRERKRLKDRSLKSADNETYSQECAACHFAYQPGLLPSRSWTRLLDSLPSHFGEELSIDSVSVQKIREYLKANAAEFSSSKRAREILGSLDGQTPLRITETPYILEEHHELDPDVFQRESIGSRSNCQACHPTADQGKYDDDLARVPK